MQLQLLSHLQPPLKRAMLHLSQDDPPVPAAVAEHTHTHDLSNGAETVSSSPLLAYTEQETPHCSCHGHIPNNLNNGRCSRYAFWYNDAVQKVYMSLPHRQEQLYYYCYKHFTLTWETVTIVVTLAAAVGRSPVALVTVLSCVKSTFRVGRQT